MNSDRIYKAIGDADCELVERSERKAGTKKPVWAQWGAAAACLCLVVAGTVALYGQRAPAGTNGPGITGAIISSYDAGVSGSIYAPPENGKILYFTEVQAALDANAGKDATYFVSIDLYRDGISLDPAGSEVKEELGRLAASGYQVGFATSWAYQGEDEEQVDITYPAGYFTAGQLKNFAADSKYGYAFSFAANGDGSAVSPDQKLTTEFSS